MRVHFRRFVEHLADTYSVAELRVILALDLIAIGLLAWNFYSLVTS